LAAAVRQPCPSSTQQRLLLAVSRVFEYQEIWDSEQFMRHTNRSIAFMWLCSLLMAVYCAASPALAQSPNQPKEADEALGLLDPTPSTSSTNAVADEYFRELFRSWSVRNNLAPVLLAPKGPPPVIVPNPWPSVRPATPVAPRLGCAENGSCYGDISTNTWKPKTVHVPGYFRRDGTYVRGHYKSH